MLSGVFATTATMELRNLIDQYCYDCSEGWFMVYAETGGKYEEFYQDLLSDATANKHFESSQKLLKSSFVNEIFKKYLMLSNELPTFETTNFKNLKYY